MKTYLYILLLTVQRWNHWQRLMGSHKGPNNHFPVRIIMLFLYPDIYPTMHLHIDKDSLNKKKNCKKKIPNCKSPTFQIYLKIWEKWRLKSKQILNSFTSPELFWPLFVRSASVRLSVSMSICPETFYIFDFFSKNSRPISTKLDTNHYWVKGIDSGC